MLSGDYAEGTSHGGLRLTLLVAEALPLGPNNDVVTRVPPGAAIAATDESKEAHEFAGPHSD
jgi:hypothetical protein